MTYTITKYTKEQAKKLGVKVKLSTNPNKKIDVFFNDEKICSIGSSSYYDYPTYIKLYGKEYADEKRRLYKLRHSKDRAKIGSAGYFADQLLW